MAKKLSAKEASLTALIDEYKNKIVALHTEIGAKDLEIQSRDQEIQVLQSKVGQPVRHRLPDTRRGLTHKFSIADHEGYMTVGMFEDGKPGELFVTMAKEGSTIGGLMDTIGKLTSLALQYGVPLEALVRKFSQQRFEPSGFTHNPEIGRADSIIDYVFRWLELTFKQRQAKAQEGKTVPLQTA